MPESQTVRLGDDKSDKDRAAAIAARYRGHADVASAEVVKQGDGELVVEVTPRPEKQVPNLS